MSVFPGSSGKGSSAEINVTPLIDVLLVLLIIFMIILPHRYRGEMANIPQPKTDTTAPPPETAIVVQLHDEGDGLRPALKINGEKISWNALRPRLQEVLLRRAERTVFLKSDPEIRFQYAAEVTDIMHQAGADRIGMMGAKD